MRELLESAIESLFSELVSPELISRCAQGHWAASLWEAVEETQFLRATVSEEWSGAGATWADTFVLVRAAGAHAVPVPFAETLLANWLLGRAGIGPEPGAIALGVTTTLHYTNGYASGSLVRVPWGRHLERVAAIAKGPDGLSPIVVVLELRSASAIGHGTNLAGEPRDDVRFERARVISAAPLPEGLTEEVPLLGGAMIRAAQMAGALDSVLQMTARYASERVQFGKPIARFQAIQQQLAQLAEQVASSLICSQAAFTESTLSFAELPVMAAKICAGEAAGAGASIAHAVHGAIGITDEYTLHLKTRRLWAWRAEYGSDSYWSQRLGRRICASGSSALWPALTQYSELRS